MNSSLQNNIKGFFSLASLMTIVLFSYILTYLYKLETTGCKCAEDWRRKYILVFSLLVILISVCDLIVIHLFPKGWEALSKFVSIINKVYLVAAVLFVIFTFQYVMKLKKIKCACSEDVAQDILLIVAIIDTAVLSVFFISVIRTIISGLIR
jgi:membrane-associated PAP2 superfamily phosphatase